MPTRSIAFATHAYDFRSGMGIQALFKKEALCRFSVEFDIGYHVG